MIPHDGALKLIDAVHDVRAAAIGGCNELREIAEALEYAGSVKPAGDIRLITAWFEKVSLQLASAHGAALVEERNGHERTIALVMAKALEVAVPKSNEVSS